MIKTRIGYFLIFLLLIALGLLSRSHWVPSLIYPYLGDALYAVMIFYLVATLFPLKSSSTFMFSAIIICFTIELTQLYQAEWIRELRLNKLVALILGSGFLWSDLLAYLVGAFGAYGLNRVFILKIKAQYKL
jgi:hypothetical protein